VIILNEENTKGYYIEERGFITKELIKKMLIKLEAKKYDLDMAIDLLRTSLEKAFEETELSPEQLKKYKDNIALGILFACEFMKDWLLKCERCPLKDQCANATFPRW
jgi:hypothetical protein